MVLCFSLKHFNNHITNNFVLGYGIYIKRNGTVYKGEWKNDILLNIDEIIFQDKSKFINGQLSKTHQFIKGIFLIPHVGLLYPSSFINNNPVGPIEMIDQNGFKWLGHCKLDDVFLIPVNNNT